jgi:hypothetical protein
VSNHHSCCCDSNQCGTCICTDTPFPRIRWTGNVTILDDACACPLLTSPFMSFGRRFKDFTVRDGLLRLTATNYGCCGRSSNDIILGQQLFSADYSNASPCTPSGCTTFSCDGVYGVNYLVHYPSTGQPYWEVRVAIAKWGKGAITAPPQNQPFTRKLQLVYRESYAGSCVAPNELSYFGATYEEIGGTAAANDCLYSVPENYVGKLGFITPGQLFLS